MTARVRTRTASFMLPLIVGVFGVGTPRIASGALPQDHKHGANSKTAPPPKLEESSIPPSQLTPLDEGKLRQRALDLLHRAARDDIDTVCANAIEALVQIDPDNAVRHFHAALGSASPLIRFAACVAIGDVRNCDENDRIRRLLDDADPRVRLGAAYALYRCGDRSQGWALNSELSDSKDESQRSNAAWLIGKLGDTGAIKRLSLAESDKSMRVSTHAAAAMAALGDAGAVDRLIQYSQGDANTRVVALLCIMELGNPKTKEALLYRLNRPGNEEYLENRLICARALGKIGSKDGFVIAYESLREPKPANTDDKEQMSRIRQMAAMALGDIGDKRALPLLQGAAESNNEPRVQVAACYAICKIVASPIGASTPRTTPTP